MTQILSETKTSLRFTAPDNGNSLHEESSTGDDSPRNLNHLISELNSSVKPPQELSASDVVIRTMDLVSDQVNQYSGKFDLSELEKITRLCVDAPVLIGHRKDKLPVGRVFKAQMVKRNNENWVKVYFYWLKDAKDSESMTGNIDGGIYKECSLGFVYTKAECVKCGHDIRECGHHILNQDERKSDSQNTEPLFYYKGTQRILEISLVYRGATHNTKISNDLALADTCVDSAGLHPEENDQLPESENPVCPEDNKDWLSELAIRRERVILSSQKHSVKSDPVHTHNSNQARTLPLYDGLALVLVRQNGELAVLRDDLTKAPDSLCEYILKRIDFPKYDFALYGRLVGMRGKERRTISDLIRFLRNEGGSVRYARFYALATLHHRGNAVSTLEAMDPAQMCVATEKKSRYLSCPQSITLSKGAAMESFENISVLADDKFTITRVSCAIELTHKLTESEVARGIVISQSVEEHDAPDLYIQLENGESFHGRANTNVLIRSAGAELRNGHIHLINSRIITNLHDYSTPEDTLNFNIPIADIPSSSLARPTQAHSLALCERLVQPGILVRMTAKDLACLTENKKTEITLGAGVPGQRPFRARIIRLLISDKHELALLRINDNADYQFSVAA